MAQLTTIIEQKRQVAFQWHLVQVYKWLEFDNGRHLDNVLVYASLELRMAIERYLFEFLYLISDQKLTKDDENSCITLKGILKAIKKYDPHYMKTANFCNILTRISSDIPTIEIVDIDYLARKWQNLSNYCHKILRPGDSFESIDRKFQANGFKLIKEIVSKFVTFPHLMVQS